MDKKIHGLIQIVFAVLIIIAIFIFNDRIATLSEYGYLGIFVISLVSAASLFFPAPGWAAVIALAPVLNPYLLGIAAGVGSGIGEITGYIAGNGARDLIGNNKKELKKIEEFVVKYGILGIFVLSAIPNPIFDLAGIIAGSIRMKLWKFVVACILGRTIRYIILAYVGAFTIGLLA
ncbi:MAG: VTT domain-containing protein [Candidatus Micrarchaeota archaeon]